MPGLVNAHCHLDYTDMAGQFPPPKVVHGLAQADHRHQSRMELFRLRAVLAARRPDAGPHRHDHRGRHRSRARTAAGGLGSDAAARVFLPGNDRHQAASASRRPLFRRPWSESIRSRASRGRAGLSPHAPYSTVPELLRLSARTARSRRWRLTTHVAESAQEFEMFAHGPRRDVRLAPAQRARHVRLRPGLAGPAPGPLRRAERADLLAAHANYLGRSRTPPCWPNARVHVVHCPRSHSYFHHDPFPLRRLARAASMSASAPTAWPASISAGDKRVELNMFEEMRALARKCSRGFRQEDCADGHRQRRAGPGHGRANRRAFRQAPSPT